MHRDSLGHFPYIHPDFRHTVGPVGIRRSLVGAVAGNPVEEDNRVVEDSLVERGSLVGVDNRAEGGILAVVDIQVVGNLSMVDSGNLVRSLVAPLLFKILKFRFPLVNFTQP